MLVKLKQIRPNPFRNMALYPIDEAKIDALKASFERTGYWGNIVARQSGDAFEIAYGHHRLTTMQRTMKPGDPVELIVRDISDADMLRMMADENMDEWRTSSEIEQETIRAVVTAYAEGKIELPRPVMAKGGMSSLRNAPSFTLAKERFNDLKSLPKPYNAESIAKFLGWMSGDQVSPRVRNALAALEAGEELEAPEEIAEITKGLSSDQARRTVQAVKQVHEAHQKSGKTDRSAKATAIKAGKAIADKLRKGEGVRAVTDTADAFKPRDKKAKTPDVPDINQYTENICGKLNELFRDDPMRDSLDELLKWKEYIAPEQQKKIVRMLFNVIGRCESLVSKFESEVVGRKVHLLTKE